MSIWMRSKISTHEITYISVKYRIEKKLNFHFELSVLTILIALFFIPIHKKQN
jgi:hypothetical protein